MTQKRIVSGIRATGDLHLGNYLGALKRWVQMSEDQDTDFLFFVADLHAITTPYDVKELSQNTREITAAYIASGLDVSKVTLFAQSSVDAHPYLQWALSSIASMGWLNRMTQFKEKAGKHRENASVGLFSYPVLQAADVLIYKATHVPVGEDQKQHIELARDIAGSFNVRYDQEYFPLPEPVIMDEAARVMSLRDGSSKMSKSADSDMSRINLMDDADTIVKKIKKAKTDILPVPSSDEETEGRPEAKNLLSIYAALSDTPRQDVMNEYGGGQFSVFKTALADLAIDKLSPITSRMSELMEDPSEIDRVLIAGGERANSLAEPHLNEVKDIMGFWKS